MRVAIVRMIIAKFAIKIAHNLRQSWTDRIEPANQWPVIHYWLVGASLAICPRTKYMKVSHFDQHFTAFPRRIGLFVWQQYTVHKSGQSSLFTVLFPTLSGCRTQNHQHSNEMMVRSKIASWLMNLFYIVCITFIETTLDREKNIFVCHWKDVCLNINYCCTSFGSKHRMNLI